MATFCEVELALTNAQGDIVGARQRYASASQQASQADDKLDSLPGTYGAVVAEINAQAAANLSDYAWQTLKARLDLTLAELTVLVPDTQVAVNCFTAIEAKGAAAVQAALDAIP